MSGHITVMEREAVDALLLKRSSVVVDATANGGGHSSRIVKLLGSEGKLISIDIDPRACAVLRERLKDTNYVSVLEANFRDIDRVLSTEGISHVDAILADLGWSTNQFETAEGYEGRGFSFNADEPLLMTYGDPSTYAFTAQSIVNGWKEEDIANVLYGYADERYSRKIARAIVAAREVASIKTSGALAKVIEDALPRRGKLHPATKTFQALRIAVNDELGALTEFIEKSIEVLKPGGRLAIITFHSIEDRIVKHTFKKFIDEGKGRSPIKKPLVPTSEETRNNPRARSAKLRIYEKLETHTP
jgi:16S rRNA (cytosine1402-N4)-methyltransferase